MPALRNKANFVYRQSRCPSVGLTSRCPPAILHLRHKVGPTKADDDDKGLRRPWAP